MDEQEEVGGIFSDVKIQNTLKYFVCFKPLNNFDITVPIPIDTIYNRKCFSLQKGNKSIPLCASLLNKNGQNYLNIFIDTCPAILVETETNLNFFIGQVCSNNLPNINKNSPVILTPECNGRNFEWYQILRENCQLYYTPTEMYLNYPDIKSVTSNISLAVINDENNSLFTNNTIQWSKPIKADSSCEKFFFIPLYDDVKIIICDKHKCIRISIFYIAEIPIVTSISAYKDTSGLFTSKYDDLSSSSTNASSAYGTGNLTYIKAEPNMKIEDEEDLLYGESGNAFKMNSMVDMAFRSKSKNSEWWRRFYQPIKPSFWLFATRDNGNLEIYSMPDLKLLYLIHNVGNGNFTLTDAMEFVPASFTNQQPKEGINNSSDVLNMTPINNTCILAQEILVIALGNQGNRPLIFIRTLNDLMIYQIFSYSKGHIKIRFRKIYHDISFFEPDGESAEFNNDDEDMFLSKLRYFGNISGLNGVVVCGENPRFIFMTSKCELRVHKVDEKITFKSFAQFNNINCPNGFLYFDKSSDLKISILPSYLTYDAYWPIRKVPLRCTPRHIEYHNENNVLLLFCN